MRAGIDHEYTFLRVGYFANGTTVLACDTDRMLTFLGKSAPIQNQVVSL
jgi:hypothetical protein